MQRSDGLPAGDAAASLVARYGLAPHPEGGWFVETWHAGAEVVTANGPRSTASAILFLLDEDEEAAWHVVVSDELWLWHGPGVLEIHDGGTGQVPTPDPHPTILSADGALQHLVPAGRWQRTFARRAPAMSSCIVSPAFSYDDWRLHEVRSS